MRNYGGIFFEEYKSKFDKIIKTNKSAMTWVFGCACFAAAAVSLAGGIEQADGRPNIVLVMTDDMGFSDIGAYGSEISTPNIDTLAKNGIKFSQFYNTGRCSPTRASLLTGMYSHQVGITVLATNTAWGDPGSGLQALSADVPTIAESLQAAGYYTAMSGKWHLSNLPDTDRVSTPWSRGFNRSFVAMGTGAGQCGFFKDPDKPTGDVRTNDDDDDEAYKKSVVDKWRKLPKFILDGATLDDDDPAYPSGWYATDLITTFALDFLDNRKERRVQRTRGIRPVASDTCADCHGEGGAAGAAESTPPFFLYLSHFAPHIPLAAPQEDVDLYMGKYTEGWQAYASARFAKQKASGLIQGNWSATPEPYSFLCTNCNGYGTNGNFDHQMAVYAAMVHRIDVSTGLLVDKLRELDLFDNTLLLFFSDNGGTGESTKVGKMEGNPTDGTGKWRGGYGWGYLSNSPFRKYKSHVHEGGIASPFIAHWPAKIASRPAGSSSWERTPVHVIDLVPTLLEAAGISSRPTAGTFGPNANAAFADDDDVRGYDESGSVLTSAANVPPLEGVSFLSLLLRNPSASSSAEQQQSPGLAPRALFWEHLGRRAVRVGKWKLVAAQGSDWDLYNMDNDRAEQVNLALAKSRKLTNMVQLWNAWGECSKARENNPWLDHRSSHATSSCSEQAVASLPANEWCSVHDECSANSS